MCKEKFFCLATALVFLALTGVSVHAQQQTPTPESTNETTQGTISGQIVNERGEPMPGASVYLRAIGAMNAAGRSSSADTEGRFRVTGLEAGLYIVTGYSPAYVQEDPETDGSRTYHRLGDSIRVEMVKGGVITGTVLTPTGDPVVGLRVRALRLRSANGQVSRSVQIGAVERATDDRGVYRLYGLLPGTYLVSAGGGQGNQSFQLNPYDSDVPTYAPGVTRDAATEFTVRSGEETTADIRYRSDQGRIVSGTVKVSSMNGASIMLMPADAEVLPAASSFQAPGARGFEITGVGDGEYNIIATEFPTRPGEMIIPEVSISDPKHISVKGADVTGIELITKPPASISGRIALEPSKAPECQEKRKPLFAETLIDLQRHEKDGETIPLFMRLMGGGSVPDANGAFKFRNLSAGRYRFNPQFYARFWYLQSITVGAPSTAPPAAASKTATPKIDPAANWTPLKAGEHISNVIITLAAGAASIRGRVPVAEGGAIATGTAVFLVPAEVDKATDVLRYFVTTVASDGAFAFNNLPPGRYWSVLQNPVQAEIATVVKLRMPESAEARTKLRRTAESQKSDLQLKPCQTLADYQVSFK